ncbi:MAG: asparagine synthase (glutamine-hydrolyzing) [Bacteroidetes bacterium]|nr:asparagine synthase (glutamine-hydrolyzing) [Bacteroidota bacterium]
MCGIVGYLSRSEHTDPSVCLHEAVLMLKHRGPDDHGIWLDTQAGFGVSRLAIQDLSANGHQPFLSEDRRYVVAYNGEIYNFKSIREQLLKQGERFVSETDTEVLLKLYRQYGNRCLTKLNGMFAVAIYDTVKKKLFLARDRFGIKPLYLFYDPGGIYFASEMKAFLPFVKKLGLTWEIEDRCLYEYALFRYVSGADTLVRRVKRFKPGHWMEIFHNGNITEQPFYDIRRIGWKPECIGQTSDENRWVECVRDRLKESIRLRMISDAPIGVALSGGVDSSLITALMRELHNGDIRTYSIVFNEKRQAGRCIDESEFSSYVADRFGTRHRQIVLDPKFFTDTYPLAVWHNDEPINFPNSMGVYLFSKVAADEVKVLIGGEGADEVFAGYDYFKRNRSLYTLKNRFARVSDIENLIRFNSRELDFRQDLIDNSGFDSGVNREIYYSIHTYLQTVENRLDKMSMAAGIEMRVPFLDHNVVEASLSLPDRLKLNGLTTKYIIKQLASRYLPEKQIARPKVGFSIPLNEWLHDKAYLGKYVSILKEEKSMKRPYIKAGGLDMLLRQFHGREDTFEYSIAGRVWILMNLELWVRTFIEEKKPLDGSPDQSVLYG